MAANNIFTIECSDLPDDVVVVAFRGREALSEPYAIEIGLHTGDAMFNHDDAVLSPATLRFNLGGNAQPYHYHGVLASVELLHEHEGKMLYRCVLVPKLWQLTLTRHSNVWTDTSIDAVIKDVLEWSGLSSDDFELRIDETYDPREIIIQYKESNFAFISRWMERVGMFYFFEQGDSGEKLVIVDGKSYDDPTSGPTVQYSPAAEGDEMAAEAFSTFSSKSRALPANVELWDYDYLNPTLDVKGAHPVATSGGVGEIACYGDDNFLTPGDGDKLAKVRAEQYLATQKVFGGRGRVFHLHAGFPFTLEEHPRSDFCDKNYLITAIDFQGNQGVEGGLGLGMLNIDIDEVYISETTAILDGVQFRAPSRAPWPRIEGYESATVCGEADSEYAQLDDHGRYRVRIKFDESDLGDGKASCWVRQQQPYGGTNEGFHFPLVKNTEVLLWFMGGDCDRPVIAGVAPNVLTQSPVPVNNHTKNVIQTINLNLIEIEDNSDNMYMYFYCPIENTWIHMGVLNEEWNLIINTEGHVHFNFVGLQLIDIQQTLTENVTLDVTFNYDANWYVNLKTNWEVTIAEGDWILKVNTGDVNWTVMGDWIGIIMGDVKFMVLGDVIYTIMGDQKTVIMGDQVETILGDQNHTIIGDQNITICGKQNVNVTSDWKWNVLGHEIQMKASNSTEITVGVKNEVFIGSKTGVHVGSATDIFVGGKTEIFVGQKQAIAIAGEMAMFIGMKMELKAAIEMSIFAALYLQAGASVTIKAVGGLDLEVAGGPKMDVGSINLRTGAITLET